MSKINYKIREYNDGSSILPKGAFRISPSGVNRFFSEKTSWYRENLLDEDKKFQGSTASELGNICHHVCEVVANCKITDEKYDSTKLHNAVANYINELDPDIYDQSLISSLWEGMSELLVKEYVLQTNTLITEPFVYNEILSNIFPSGSIDAITSTAPTDTWEDALKGTNIGVLTIRDWKTTGTKPSSMGYGYTLQIYTYAWILRQMGVNIEQVELCYAVRPTKTLPARVFNFKKPFDDQAYDFIEGILKLIAESVQAWNQFPSCRYLLAADYRLKIEDLPKAE